jgi:glycosyltransferase involved in cell wall biosynthesis
VLTNCQERARLAVITSHPIQYNAPWFHWITAHSNVELKVFYLWDFGVAVRHDRGFGRSVQWDVPLLEGYAYQFVPNVSRKTGTHRFFGLRNPTLLRELWKFRPHAALLIGYRYASMMRLILTSKKHRGFPLLFRGDSHRLVREEVTWRAKARRQVIRAIYSRFEGFLYVGRANRDYFRMHGVPDEKLFFSPHAVDNDRFFEAARTAGQEAAKFRRQLGIPLDHLVVLFAGKFEDKKRPLDLLGAFIALDHPNASLLFVGSGALEAEMRERARNNSNVFFAPFQNQTEMPRTYAASDLFVLPSHGSEESWGLAVNEAMCLARAIIVSNQVGCAADLLRPGENGLVFPAGDVPALTSTLREALSNRDRLWQWGENSQRIVSSYSYERATKGVEQAIGSVLPKKHEGCGNYHRS